MKKINILLVDDRMEGLVTLEAVLNNPEYNLVKASSGKEALARVLEYDFAVILMDVQMPDMDGFETTSIIKQREKSKNIPIIFMTANSKTDQFISMGYSVGAVDYVLKPFDAYVLKSKVAVFADLYNKKRQLEKQNETLREVERRDRMRVLQELEMEGRRRYQSLADAIPQIIFRANSQGSIEYFNQFWLVYTGRNLNESVGLGWQNVIHPQDLAVVTEKWTDSEKGQRGFECECRILHGQSNEYRWHLLRVVPELGSQAEMSWIGVATDIQSQKSTQQELLLSKKLADTASETKSRFLANMSHEIRTPLGVILGFSELLMDPKASAKEKQESIAVIRRNGEQLSKIIDEILDLSKVEAGKMDVEKNEISIADLMDGVKTFMSLPSKEKGLDLQFRASGLIPAKIMSSANRIQQILVNLIGNGIKFTPKGKIVVEVSHHHPFLQISVKDSGPGLTAAQIDKLFQPFTQVDTSMTRKHGGTGLGLALSRKLARALGGDLQVHESQAGEGCEFILTLATNVPETAAMIDNLDVKPRVLDFVETETLKLKDLKILLVEDSPDNQFLVTRFLTREGATVDIANNGVEGVAKASAGSHDLVLMDIQMPELDGYGAITQLRAQLFKTPIIALTAHGLVEERQKCLDIGANDHLTKPVNRAALVERIRQLAL